ncbi:SMC-Scp complex subunit ScpB [Methylocaldum marinum]|uniref:SMC-Scp complex subunit ScpB n=1 Tax=Methylocaldum marinum TaxID=1432792 RepID=UPI000E68F56F|nr:SMC-Scp complex subunit ScpB [Methylocaldum marinum]
MELKTILEAALLAAGRPLSLAELENLFAEDERPEPAEIQTALAELAEDCRSRAVELKQVASGYRLQIREAFSPWVSRLFEERPGRYSRAFLETLAIIAYRQPVTRGDIEDIRGVAVSSNIVRTLQERGWIHVVGHKEVPGRPALLATTRHFLDYFNLKSLEELPPLQEFIDDLALQPAPQDQVATENANPESIE